MTHPLLIIGSPHNSKQAVRDFHEMAQACVLQISPVGFPDSLTTGSEAWLLSLLMSKSRMEFPFHATLLGGCQSAG